MYLFTQLYNSTILFLFFWFILTVPPQYNDTGFTDLEKVNIQPLGFIGGLYVWSDGTNTYCSNYDNQLVLQDGKWVKKTWNGLTDFDGSNVWTDGTNMYYSYCDEHYVLNGDTWEKKAWNGLNEFWGGKIWTDETNIYYSDYDEHYILKDNKWEKIKWKGLEEFEGENVWNCNGKTYYSKSYDQYVLNGDTWKVQKWKYKFIPFISIDIKKHDHDDLVLGSVVWTDGETAYMSVNQFHFVLNGDTWEWKSFKEFSNFNSYDVWTDGENYYCSDLESEEEGTYMFKK